MLPVATLDDQRLSTYGPECSHGTVHATNQHLLGALKTLSRTLAITLQSGLRGAHVFSIKSSRLQPACDVLGMVGKNDFRSGALDAGQNFQHNSLFVQPALLRRGFDHGELSADIVPTDRNIKRVSHAPNDIQVSHRVPYHHHIRAFCDIAFHSFPPSPPS